MSFVKQLIWSSPVCTYSDLSLLDKHIERLRENRFHIEEVDASGFTQGLAISQLMEQLNPEDSHTRNLSGLEDYLGSIFKCNFHPEDLDIPGMGAEFKQPVDDPGHVFVFRNFDALLNADADSARLILNEFHSSAWYWLVDGHYLICLVHLEEHDADDLEKKGLRVTSVTENHPI